MTGMNELMTWLHGVLDETEQLATAALPGNGPKAALHRVETERTLARVAAERAVLAQCQVARAYFPEGVTAGTASYRGGLLDGLDAAVRALAHGHRHDAAGYDPAWAPDDGRDKSTPAPEVVTRDRQEYDELRLAGQPPGGYPPYDVTVRSDSHDRSNGESRWKQLQSIARLALGLRGGGPDGLTYSPWSDVTVERRHVVTTRTETAWVAVPEEELAELASEDTDHGP